MSFCAKDIKWAVVDIGDCYCGEPCFCVSEKRGVSKQASVKLRLNREKLFKEIFKANYPNLDITYHGNKFEVNLSYRIADAIIAADKEIIEVEVEQ